MYNLNYDPIKDGYDDVNTWKTLSGTPAISSGKLRISNAETIGFADITGGYYVFKINVPTPDVSTDKEFGLNSNAIGNKATFKIDGTDLVCSTKDNSYTIAWDSAWEGTDVEFKIDATGQDITFIIAGKTICNLKGNLNSSMSIYLKNGVADNMDVSYISIKNAKTYI